MLPPPLVSAATSNARRRLQIEAVPGVQDRSPTCLKHQTTRKMNILDMLSLAIARGRVLQLCQSG